jgi:hypothetical protein
MERPDCGTDGGYRWHYSHGEPRCQPCKTAHAARNRERKGLAPYARQLAPCGTSAAYGRHRKAGEAACDPCKAAEAARKSGPCAGGCGGRVSLGTGSRPASEAMCNPCRVALARPNIHSPDWVSRAQDVIHAERYGREHALERLRQLAELDPQAPCPRCLAPLGDDPTRLDLDHDDEDPTRYLGLAHSYCNRAHLPVLLIM